MGHFKAITPAQRAIQRQADGFNELPLLDDEFDEEIDFHDTHLAALEITNQFTSHSK